MAISVGVFFVLTIGAAILVFTPKNTNLPFETIAGNANPGTITIIPPSSYQPPPITSSDQQQSIDAIDLVRNPGGVPGLVTPPEGVNSQANDSGRGSESVINIIQPTTAAVPNTAPTGRAANQPTPPTATRPAQTTNTPPQTTARPAQTTTSDQTASRPAPASTTLAQTAPTQTTPVQTASRPAQTTPAPTASMGSPTEQIKIYDNYWVQTGAFSTIASAEGVKETLASKGITSIIENGNVNGRTLFRVRVGPYTSQNEANYWLALIKAMDGFEDSQVRQTQSLR